MKPNLPTGIFFVAVLAVALPLHADAQQSVFVRALSELTAAIEGTYGDEGAQVGPAIDRMSAALTEWDREIEAAETGLRSALRAAASSGVFERRVSLGRMYAERGRLPTRCRSSTRPAASQPTRADVHVLRGLVLSADGKRPRSDRGVADGAGLDPGNPVTAYYLFHEALISGNASGAQEASKALAAAYPKLLQAEPRKERRQALRSSVSHRFQVSLPAHPFCRTPRTARRSAPWHAASTNGRLPNSARRRRATRSLADPAARSGLMARAFGALRQGRVTDSRALLEQSGPPRDSSEAHRLLGLVYWAESEYDRSIASLTAAINLSPRDERARLALARVLNAAGRDADAERALHDTVRVLPDSALAHWWLSLAYEQVNRPAEARQEVEQVTAAAVLGESQLHAAIGRFALRAADGPGAIDAFARAVRANPNDPAMHRLLASTLMQQDRADEALAEFVAVLLIDPLDAAAHAGIGQIHLQAGRDADAVDALRRATDLAPADSETRYALATALERLGRTKEAAQHFARVEQAQRQMLADRRRELSAAVAEARGGVAHRRGPIRHGHRPVREGSRDRIGSCRVQPACGSVHKGGTRPGCGTRESVV